MTPPVRLYTLLILCRLGYNSYAGTRLPVDASSGEVVFKRSFTIHSNFTDEDAYAMVQDWFNADAGKFTCQNASGPNVTCKNKTIVEQEFNNAQPLQSLDPASGRMSGKGVIKYFGGATSSIGVLYMEYYVLIEVKGHQLTATVSKMKYHHYNTRTYAEKPIYGWQGGRPYDSADRLENLVNDQNESRDTQDVGNFVNQNIEKLFSDLKLFLQGKKALS